MIFNGSADYFALFFIDNFLLKVIRERENFYCFFAD